MAFMVDSFFSIFLSFSTEITSSFKINCLTYDQYFYLTAAYRSLSENKELWQ